MDLDALWDKALKHTEIVRSRIEELATFEPTPLPYIFLAESSLNQGDTVVRRGQVLIDRAALMLPTARFEGFDFEREMHASDDAVLNFLLVRGIRFPSLRFRHEHSALDVREGPLRQAIEHFAQQLARREDTRTGLVVGPEDAWQFSVMIFVAHAAVRSAEGDVRRLLDEWRRKQQRKA